MVQILLRGEDRPPTRANRVVYVSRPPHAGMGNAADGQGEAGGMRVVLNEAEVIKSLRRALRAVPGDWELVVFAPRDHGLPATRRVFAAATIVVGVHGGGLANVIFCRPGAHLVEAAMPEPLYSMCVTKHCVWCLLRGIMRPTPARHGGWGL